MKQPQSQQNNDALVMVIVMAAIIANIAMTFAVTIAYGQEQEAGNAGLCQDRTYGGDLWALPPSPGESYGHVTFGPAWFEADYPATASSAVVLSYAAWIPTITVNGQRMVWTDLQQWQPWVPDALSLDVYEVYRELYVQTIAHGDRPLVVTPHLEMENHTVYAGTARSYGAYRFGVLVRQALRVRVC